MPTADELAEGPTLKIERATKHVHDLKGEIEQFLAGEPFRLVVRYKRKLGKVQIAVKSDKAVPKSFALLVGDAVHNLRSSLDLAMYSVASSRSPTPHKIEFPFPRQASGLKSAIDAGHVKFGGEKVAETVRRYQPYPEGHGLLSGLHRLDLFDKHRLLIFTARAPEIPAQLVAEYVNKFSSVKLGAGPGAFIKYTGEGDVVIDIGAEFVTKDLPDTEVETEVQPTFDIVFAQGFPLSGSSVLGALNGMVDLCREVVAALIEAHLAPDNTFPT